MEEIPKNTFKIVMGGMSIFQSRQGC